MSIVERARELIAELQSTVGGSAADEIWRHVAACREELAPQVEGLARQLGRGRVLGIEPSNPQLRDVRVALGQVRKTFNERPGQLGQGKVVGELRRSLTTAVVGQRNQADGEWSGLRATLLTDSPEGLLKVYAAVPNARERARRAAALLAGIASRDRPPSDIEGLTSFKEEIDELKHLLADLRSVDLPPDVALFLEKGHRGDARWAHLTPNVMKWLEEHEMLETLRLKIV